MRTQKKRIAVIGLGYVGLPLAVELGKKYEVIGFDTEVVRIGELRRCYDRTRETAPAELQAVLNDSPGRLGLYCTFQQNDIADCTYFIVTVPTPIDRFKTPDLQPLLHASKMIASYLKKGDIVIFESTVFPGCTEEICVPALEKHSGLRYNKDFFCGYSPERINPGDKINRLSNIVKVTSGSSPAAAIEIDNLYKSIITAGTHLAPSITVAEAAKSIENAQRDVNISFMNELALIFDKLGIDTNDVLEAASTKWNFLPFKPGLVGGHCIGVDPYYLAHKAQEAGYVPQVILSGRQVNDNMGKFVADKVIKLLIRKRHRFEASRALILGVTFKENCPDFRNTRVLDIFEELRDFGMETDMYDPHVDAAAFEREYGIQLIDKPKGQYDAIVVAVPHTEFAALDFAALKKSESAVIFDTKALLSRDLVDARL